MKAQLTKLAKAANEGRRGESFRHTQHLIAHAEGKEKEKS